MLRLVVDVAYPSSKVGIIVSAFVYAWTRLYGRWDDFRDHESITQALACKYFLIFALRLGIDVIRGCAMLKRCIRATSLIFLPVIVLGTTAKSSREQVIDLITLSFLVIILIPVFITTLFLVFVLFSIICLTTIAF